MTYFKQNGDVFLRNIYQSAKGAIRLAILQRDLQDLMTGEALNILDIGGGAGQMALWYASFGHQVKVIDLADNLLEKAREEALHLGLKIDCVHGDIFNYDHSSEKYDFIACHAVLEWVENKAKLLEVCQKMLKKGGILSLMFYNRDALEYAQYVYGNFYYLDSNLEKKSKNAKLTPQYPCNPQEVRQILHNLQFSLQVQSNIRCFYDFMKDKDRERHSIPEIVKRELALSRDKRFENVARYLHIIAKLEG